MLSFKEAKQFRKDLKRARRNPYFNIERLRDILSLLQNNQVLPEKYKNHKLHGEFTNCFECHIQPDLLLIYEIDEVQQLIYLYRIGSHSDLF